MRLMLTSMLVGFVTGLGAILFYVATVGVAPVALGEPHDRERRFRRGVRPVHGDRGCGGGGLGVPSHRIWPDLVPLPGSFVVLGMGAFFAAVAKTPFSTLVIVSEMTGSYQLLRPALWGCRVAFLLSDERAIDRSPVEDRTHSPAHRRVRVA
jgi:H+/Cl- antiporter ClcA